VRFRAKGGPLFKLADGTTVPLAAKGPFTFRRYCKRLTCEWIEASDRDGFTAILHIAGRRRKVSPEIVPRPYRITSTIRKKERQRPCTRIVTGSASRTKTRRRSAG
jgi:hypothetical protein